MYTVRMKGWRKRKLQRRIGQLETERRLIGQLPDQPAIPKAIAHIDGELAKARQELARYEG